MRAALVRRITREGFNVTEAPMMRAGARPAEVVFALLHPRGTYRLRVGPRIAALEGRVHDTETGRCSAGKWERLAQWDSPVTVGECGVILSLAWEVVVGEGTLAPTTFEGVAGYARGDANRCRTRAHSDAVEPTAGGGSAGRGRVGRSLPGSLGAFGFAPANGPRAGTHSPGKIRAAVRRERQRRASQEYRNTRGDRTPLAQ